MQHKYLRKWDILFLQHQFTQEIHPKEVKMAFLSLRKLNHSKWQVCLQNSFFFILSTTTYCKRVTYIHSIPTKINFWSSLSFKFLIWSFFSQRKALPSSVLIPLTLNNSFFISFHELNYHSLVQLFKGEVSILFLFIIPLVSFRLCDFTFQDQEFLILTLFTAFSANQ